MPRAKAKSVFLDPGRHGFVRVGACVPPVAVAEPAKNAAQVLALLQSAQAARAALLVFPELALSAYAIDDLLFQSALLDAVEAELARLVTASRDLASVFAVGAPLRWRGRLYNCGVVIHRGRVLGVVPKTYLPNYREFYEARYFASGDVARQRSVELAGQVVPFGSRLLFQAANQPKLTVHIEICEDVWVPIPPSSYAALAGATVLMNLSGSNVTIAKADYRRQLVSGQSARCLAAYLYSGTGPGESTTDLAWDGHALIYENGNLIAESHRFSVKPQMICGELDLERLSQERMRQTSFGEAIRYERQRLREFRTIPFALELPRQGRLIGDRVYERFPYVPSDPATRDERCAEVYDIQVQGLAKRLSSTGIKTP